MGKPDAPEPPDPRETSAASTSTNVGTAIANAFMGNVNRIGPDGTTSYDQTGSYTWRDPYTGQSYNIPRFTETVNLSPQQQATYDQSKAAEYNLAELANQQSGFLTDYMSKPVDLSNEAVESRLFELGSKRLDPMFARRQDAERTRLANQGIGEGSEAYARAMERVGQQENDAYNQLLLTGRGQSVQEALTARNQPINEITALLSGSQVSQPQFTGQQQPTIPTTDTAGLINANYAQQMNAYNQQMAQSQGILGGLFGLGAAGIMASDREMKTDIEEIGKDPETGLMMYAYRYKGDPKSYPKSVGPMAQDIEKVKPSAIERIGGKMLVRKT